MEDKEQLSIELEQYFLNEIKDYSIQIDARFFPNYTMLFNKNGNIIFRYNGKRNYGVVNLDIWRFFKKIYDVDQTCFVLKHLFMKYLKLDCSGMKFGIIPAEFYYDENNENILTIRMGEI